jgi:hypothetical protein
MTGHGAKFGRKKEDAIVALLTHRTIEEAACAVGISTKTLLRRQKEPEFDDAFRAAKRAAFGQSIARLHHLSSAAALNRGRSWSKCQAQSYMDANYERLLAKEVPDSVITIHPSAVHTIDVRDSFHHSGTSWRGR